jgi:hypothetical protein
LSHLRQSHHRSRWWHHPCLFIFIKQANGVSVVRYHLHGAAPPQMLQLGRCRSCSLPSTYHPCHRILSGQSSSRGSFFLAGHNNSMYLSACQDDVRIVHFSTAMTTSTLTSATLALRGYHLHVVLIGFFSSHNIRAVTTLQLRGDVSSSDSTFDLFSSLTICGAPAVIAGGC